MNRILKHGLRQMTAVAAGAMMAAGVAIPAQAVEPVNIRLASDHSAAPHPAGIAEEFFKQRVEEEIPGSNVRLYPSSALYKVPAAVEAMTNGDLEMTWGQFGKTAQIDPYMSVVVGPMLLTTPGAIDQIEEFETYEMLEERFEKIHNVKVFGTGHLSFFMGAGAGERLLEPEDFQGKKIRSMGPAENAALQAWGANPTTMAFGDVPPALQTKVIDGLLTSLGGFNAVKDQAPYFTIAGINGIVGDYYWIGASKLWWNSLSEDQQQVLEKIIVDEMLPFQKKINWCNDQRLIDQYGTKDPSQPGIYIMKPEEAEKLADKLGDSTQQWIKANTPSGAHEWVDKFVEEAKAASEANPMGEHWLSSTDCSEVQPWFDKYTKQN
ncbi:MAG TPA: TRAP transporter substrate-binding protein DctP [Alphaproteobacteria bacterium]|nr:TRAP transporter substrate-binding protein DctP [Alphaproteobacteria bacterium]